LIKWSGLPASLATWENVLELKTRFPRAPAWGQAVGEGGENVTNAPPRGREGELGPRAQRVRQPNSRYPETSWTR
jgi:hypothetical protein